MIIYPLEATITEELNKLIEDNKPLEKDIIKQYIDYHRDVAKEASEGERYYFKENDINDRKIKKYTDEGAKVTDEDATNNKLASGWHKLLVDQKISYLAGSPIAMNYEDDTDPEDLFELLGDEFDDTIPELIKGASNTGVDWLHPFIDEGGEFDYMVVPMREFIPIYDNSKRKNLIAGIRFYELDHDDIVKVEYWQPNQITFYQIVEGKIELDVTVDENPAPHFKYGPEGNRAGYGWSTKDKTAIPFIPFRNNNEGVSDLTFYKDIIDMYDKLMSDTGNTLEDVQQFIYAIKGYSGTDVDHAVTNLKRYKGVAVDGDGGLDIVQGDVPMESVNSYLDRLKEDIFAFGQGLDVSADKFGNNPSGVSLKFLFSLLDMKANVLERSFTKSLKQFMWYVTEYARIAGIGDYDPHKVKFTFNKSMLVNEREQIEMLNNSPDLSWETKMANHPFVDNVEEERRRKEQEQDEYTREMPDIEEEDDG